MVGVIIIAVLFTALAGGIFWAAGKGRLTPVTNAMLTQGAVGRRVINVTLVVTFIGFGIVIPAIFLVGNHDRASAQVAGVKLTAAEKSGRELFGEHCAVCHTLAAAAAAGKTGPNLDQIKPGESLCSTRFKTAASRARARTPSRTAWATARCRPTSFRDGTLSRWRPSSLAWPAGSTRLARP